MACNAIFLACCFLSLIEFLTSLRLERSARPLKGIMRGLSHLKESSLDLGSPLMIPFKGLPDLSSRTEVTNMIKLGKRQTRKESITGLAIGIVLVNLLLTNLSSKHIVIWILTNLLDPQVYALEVRRHADLPIRVVYSIKERRLAGTTPLHVDFEDHRPIKLE